MKFRNTLITISSTFCLLGSVYAAQDTSPGGSDGCGLGWEVTGEKTMLATTTRGTTNAFVPPTFGMTSGTIGCETHRFVQKEEEAVKFAAVNHDSLVVEMAQGNGEHIEALAMAMGCSSSQDLGAKLQHNYESVVVDGDSGVDLYVKVRDLVNSDASLTSSCIL